MNSLPRRVWSAVRESRGRATSAFAAARYGRPVLLWTSIAGVAVLAVTGAVVAWIALLGASPVRSAPPGVAVIVTAQPGPAPLTGSNDPVKAAKICRAAARELAQVAAKHPVYANLTGPDRARTEVLLSTVGERCDADTARASALHLSGWLTGARP